jgi:hypothetical protein
MARKVRGSALHGIRETSYLGYFERRRSIHRFLPTCERLEERNTPDDISAGPNGINARVLGLHFPQNPLLRPRA